MLTNQERDKIKDLIGTHGIAYVLGALVEYEETYRDTRIRMGLDYNSEFLDAMYSALEKIAPGFRIA